MAGRRSVWDFVQLIESSCSCGALPLVARKVDKKKERNLLFAIKQRVMDMMREETENRRILLLAIDFSIYNDVSGFFLDIPLNSSIELTNYLLFYIKEHSKNANIDSDLTIITQLMDLINSNSESENITLSDEILINVKQIVLRSSKK
jgi:hypothetical protein